MSRSLLKSVSLVSFMSLISRVLGFARDLLAAQFFGVTPEVDAFYIAFKIPNFMRNLFAEGAFSQTFVPVLADYKQKHSSLEVKTFISHLLGLMILILTLFTVFGVLRSQDVISLFSPGLDSYRFTLASNMLKITFPYLMAISLTAFAAAILNSYGKFVLSAFTPALLNIILIITAVYFSKYFVIPINSQVWGIFLAGFAQLIVQVFAVKRLGFLVWPKLSLRDKGVRRVGKLILPALFGASLQQITVLFNTILASFLITGSVTWLYYAERLAYFPLGIFGVALATVILPHLSNEHAKASSENFSQGLDWGIKWNLIIGIPASMTMLLLPEPLIISLFHYGKFTLYDIAMTKVCVIAYAVGLQSFMLMKLLSSAFYARQDVRTAVRISIISLASSVIFSLILIKPMHHAGLALSTSLSSWLNVILLAIILYRRKILKLDFWPWAKFMGKLAIINSILFVFLWFFTKDTAQWLAFGFGRRFLELLFLGGSAVVIYVLALFALRAIPRIKS
jgi:putative peptidoglycan lipid II flippase